MKKPAFLFILLAISFISLSQSKLDILHYRFQIAVTDQSDSIYGVAFIQFKLLENSAAMDFDFTARHGKGMQIIKLQFSNSKSGKVNYTHAKEKLSIRNAIYKKNDTATVIIHYKGIPSGGFIIARNKFGQRTFFADNWPNRAHHWLPCNDDPSDKAPVEFLVTAPDHYRVVSNGMQLEETILNNGYKLTHWREEIPIATKVLALGIADFAVEITGYANSTIPVYSWAFPADAEKAVHDFSLTKEILEYYIRTIGPYGYKKLANVQSKTMFGGLENANAISYSENRIHGDGSNEALLAHEVAHQWFGNMATEKSFGHLWLSEGFATYFTILYLENKYGKDTSAFCRHEDRNEIIAFSKMKKSPVVDLFETRYMNLLNENSYQKGGWILHMLRHQLGDSVFYPAIRKYYATYAGRNAGTEDLQKIFEEVSGKNLTVFFKQWLYTTGQPNLKISWKYNSLGAKTEITILQKQNTEFVFPLELLLSFPSGKLVRHQVQVDKRVIEFSIPVNEAPISLIADPDIHLLFTSAVIMLK